MAKYLNGKKKMETEQDGSLIEMGKLKMRLRFSPVRDRRRTGEIS
jgi:hypothetical protein